MSAALLFLYAAAPECAGVNSGCLVRETTQLRISRDGSRCMARHFNLGDDGDVPVSSILYHVFNLLLSIIAAILFKVIPRAGMMANNGSVAAATHLCK